VPGGVAPHRVVVPRPCELHRLFPLLLAAGLCFLLGSAPFLEQRSARLDLSQDLPELVVQAPPFRVAPTPPAAPVGPIVARELDHESSGGLVHHLGLDALPVVELRRVGLRRELYPFDRLALLEHRQPEGAAVDLDRERRDRFCADLYQVASLLGGSHEGSDQTLGSRRRVL
jgi:hypothetical protein